MTKLSHYFEYAAYQAVAQTVGNLPLSLGAGFGAWFGRIVGMRTGLRKRAELNLAYAMPNLTEAERREILVGMFDCLARTSVEYRSLALLTRECSTRIEFEGLEHLKSARDAGQGAVLVTGHFGNWEAVRIAFAHHGWPPALIYRAFNNAIFDASAQKTIGAIKAPLFHKGRRGSLGMLRHVRAGGCALILTDQRSARAPEVPFFGHPAETSLGAAEIALNYGAALLPVRGERLGRSSRFRVVIAPPIKTDGRTALDLTVAVNEHLEAWVRARPEQYFWLHNRWGKDALRGVDLSQ